MLLTFSKRQWVFFPLLKRFLETEMTWSQRIVVRECFFRIRTYVSCHVEG